LEIPLILKNLYLFKGSFYKLIFLHQWQKNQGAEKAKETRNFVFP